MLQNVYTSPYWRRFVIRPGIIPGWRRFVIRSGSNATANARIFYLIPDVLLSKKYPDHSFYQILKSLTFTPLLYPRFKMKMLLIAIILSVLQLLAIPAYAQNNFVATGSTSTSATGEVSVSVGLVGYVADSSNAGSVSEGNQQTYDITDGIIKIPADGYSVKAFPNPFPGNIYITIAGEVTEAVDVELYSQQGNLLKHKTFTASDYMLKTENLAPGSYIILIRSKSFETRKYKLIKNK